MYVYVYILEEKAHCVGSQPASFLAQVVDLDSCAQDDPQKTQKTCLEATQGTQK